MNPTHPTNNTTTPADGPGEVVVILDDEAYGYGTSSGAAEFGRAVRRARRVGRAAWVLRLVATVIGAVGLAETLPAPTGNPLTAVWSAVPDLLVAPLVAWRALLVTVALMAAADGLEALARRGLLIPAGRLATYVVNAFAGGACGAVTTWFGARMILEDPRWWGWVITNVPGIALTATGLGALELAARQLHALTRIGTGTGTNDGPAGLDGEGTR